MTATRTGYPRAERIYDRLWRIDGVLGIFLYKKGISPKENPRLSSGEVTAEAGPTSLAVFTLAPEAADFAAAFQVEKFIDLCEDARNQIEYLHSKFKETGTGNAILAKLEARPQANWL